MHIFKRDIVAGILIALLLAIASSVVQAGKDSGHGIAEDTTMQESHTRSMEQHMNQNQHQTGSVSGKGHQTGEGSKQQVQEQEREQTQTRTQQAQ